MNYLWIKALHIIFMVTWFAGLFYLPRLFVYHAESQNDGTLDEAGHQRFLIMQRKLFIIMSIGMVLTYVFGFYLLGKNPGLMQMKWLSIKLTCVVLLTVYHFYCHKLHVDFREKRNKKSGRFFRLFNEVPALFLFVIVILVVVKP